MTANVSQTNGSEFLYIQPASEWRFADDYAALWALGTITMNLSGPVSAFGTDLQPVFRSLAMQMSALDAVGNVLYDFNLGPSDILEGESTLFVGMSSTLANISGVRWEILPGGSSFAMNRVSLNTATVVPEPVSSSLVGTGLAALFLMARRRRVR